MYEALKEAKRTADFAEEKRLLYVTLTRARDYLVLTTAQEADKRTNCAFNLLEFPFTSVAEESLDAYISSA